MNKRESTTPLKNQVKFKTMTALSKVFWKLSNRLPILIRKKTVLQSIDGIKYELDLTEVIDRTLFYVGEWEKYTSACLKKYIKPDMTVFEIGSNIGAHTFQIAKLLMNGKGRLYSFEPTTFAFKKLERNWSLNRFNNIVLENIGLADENGVLELKSSQLCFKSSWNIKDRKLCRKHGDKIELMKLDDYVEQKNIKQIDFIKMDTDGYELKILNGGKNSISKFRPIMLLEVSECLNRVGHSVKELIELLKSLNYQAFSVEDESLLSWDDVLLNPGDILFKVDKVVG